LHTHLGTGWDHQDISPDQSSLVFATRDLAFIKFLSGHQ